MKRLEDMSLEELWQLFPIILSAPDKRRFVWAADEISYLQDIIGNLVSNISHIGSTAINGICTKPIIDLLVETDCKSNFATLKSKITGAGYLCMNESENRIDFNKGYTINGFADKVFHLHLRLTGDNDEIRFRDYLNSHPDVAKEYETLKMSLWKRFEHDRDGYTNAKSDFVNYYTAIAKQQE